MNLIPRLVRLWTAVFVIASMSVMISGPALAGLAPSHLSGATDITSVRDADMLMAQRVLEHKVVAQKLHDYGLTPEQAQTRLASMSDRDLHTLASASRGLPSGGDATGALIGVLVVVVLVIVILKLTNHDVIVR